MDAIAMRGLADHRPSRPCPQGAEKQNWSTKPGGDAEVPSTPGRTGARRRRPPEAAGLCGRSQGTWLPQACQICPQGLRSCCSPIDRQAVPASARQTNQAVLLGPGEAVHGRGACQQALGRGSMGCYGPSRPALRTCLFFRWQSAAAAAAPSTGLLRAAYRVPAATISHRRIASGANPA